MKHVTLLTFLLLFSWLLLCSHEFWISPSGFRINPGERIRFSLWVGENFTGEVWEAGASRITRFGDVYGEEGERNLLDSIYNDRLDSIYVRFEEPGTHEVVLATNFKFISLEADKFNAYLAEDGLDDIIAIRHQRGETGKPSRERYCRNAKTLIQVGPSSSLGTVRPVGLPCELIPMDNPYRVSKGDSIAFEIRFHGRPLAGVLVRHWNKPAANNQHLIATARSDANGRVVFVRQTGETLVSAVYMRPCPDPLAADWESYWASVTFN